MADVGDGHHQPDAASWKRLRPHRVVEVAGIRAVDGDQVQAPEVSTVLPARFGLRDAPLNAGRLVHDWPWEMVAEATRHHQGQHILGGVSGATERTHHLAPEGLCAVRGRQSHAHHVAVLGQLCPRHPHHAAHGAFVWANDGSIPLQLVGADQLRALAFQNVQDFGLGAAAAPVHADAHPVAVQGLGRFRGRNEEVLVFADIDEAEATLVHLKAPLAHQAAGASGACRGGCRSAVRPTWRWLRGLGHRETLAVPTHAAGPHQLRQGALGRSTFVGRQPRAPQEVLQPKRVAGSPKRLE